MTLPEARLRGERLPGADPPLGGGPAARPRSVLELAERLHLPEALAALLVQRGQADAGDARGAILRPALDRAVRSRARSPAWPRRWTPSPPRCAPAAPSWCTATTTWTASAPPRSSPAPSAPPAADVVPFVPHRLRDGYDFGPAGLAAAQRGRRLAGHHLRLRHHGGGDGARGAGGRHRRGRHRSPPARRRAAAGRSRSSIPQRPDDTSGLAQALRHRHRLQAGAGAGARARAPGQPAATTCSTWWRWPRWPTWCRSQGENRILVKHGLRLLADSRWPGLRALVEASGLAGKELRAGHIGFILGPRLNAAGRIGDAADGLRLLLTDDPAEAAALARRLEGLNVERQALDQRILDEALDQVEQAADLERDAGFVLAGEGWHPGRGRHRGVARGRALRPAGVPDRLRRRHRQGLGPEHLPVRSPRGAARLRRPARALRRPPHGRRAHHPARPAGRVPRAVRRDRARAARARRTSARSSGWTSSSGCTRPRHELERLCRHLEPCGTGNASPVFGVRGVRLAGRAAGRAAGTSRARSTTAPRGSRRSASSGRTGCPGSATARWTRRSGWSCNEWNGQLDAAGAAVRARAARRRSAVRPQRLVTLSEAKGA